MELFEQHISINILHVKHCPNLPALFSSLGTLVRPASLIQASGKQSEKTVCVTHGLVLPRFEGFVAIYQHPMSTGSEMGASGTG